MLSLKKQQFLFETGLNVFTGETGAGKSIVIDAINAILGQRISKDIVRTGTDKAVVHALFHNLSPNVLDKLTELGYEMDGDELMIQREISSDSKAW